MDPKFVGAKLEADKVAREAKLWRALESLSFWNGGTWISLLLLGCACFILITADLSPKIMSALTAVLLINFASQAHFSRQLGAVVELMRMRLKE